MSLDSGFASCRINGGGFFGVHRKLKTDVAKKITEVEAKLSAVANDSSAVEAELRALEADAKSLHNAVKELAEQLEFIKISDVRGLYLRTSRNFGRVNLALPQKGNGGKGASADLFHEHFTASGLILAYLFWFQHQSFQKEGAIVFCFWNSTMKCKYGCGYSFFQLNLYTKRGSVREGFSSFVSAHLLVIS